MKILTEYYYDFKPIRPMTTSARLDRDFAFAGDPSSVELSSIADKITDAIITVAAGGSVLVYTPNRDQRGPYEIQLRKKPAVFPFTSHSCLVELLGETTKSRSLPHRTFRVEDLLAGKTCAFVKRQYDGTLVLDTERTEKIQALVNAYFSLQAELDEFTRPEREAQELKKQRRALAHRRGISEEERFIGQLALAIPGAADEQQQAILWLAAHVGTVSAQVKEALVGAFNRYFGIDAKTTSSVGIIRGDKTATGVIKKYTWSLEASIIGVTSNDPIPPYFSQYGLLNIAGNKITASNFVARLVRDYGFEFRTYDKQSRKRLFNKLLTDFRLDNAEAEAANNPLNQDFPDPVTPTEEEE